MTETEKPMPRYTYSIVELCASIHRAYVSCDDIPLADVVSAAITLADRLSDWRQPIARSEPYDSAIRALMLVALREAGEVWQSWLASAGVPTTKPDLNFAPVETRGLGWKKAHDGSWKPPDRCARFPLDDDPRRP